MLADPYDAILLDLDGVLYRWPEPIPGASEAVAALRSSGKRIAFVTNNSSRTPARVAEALPSVGVDARIEEVVTSALATAAILVERGIGSAFVIGEDGLLQALADADIRVVDGSSDDVDAVVVGFERRADYGKLKDASVLVQRGVALVASNADASFPAPGGESWPGAGALLAAIETTTGTRGEVFGNPSLPCSSGRSPPPGAAGHWWSATVSTPTSPAPHGSGGTRCWCSRATPAAMTSRAHRGNRPSSWTTSPACCERPAWRAAGILPEEMTCGRIERGATRW